MHTQTHPHTYTHPPAHPHTHIHLLHLLLVQLGMQAGKTKERPNLKGHVGLCVECVECRQQGILGLLPPFPSAPHRPRLPHVPHSNKRTHSRKRRHSTDTSSAWPEAWRIWALRTRVLAHCASHLCAMSSICNAASLFRD
jgi:hypothetical protein